MELTKEMLNELKNRKIKEIVRCDNGNVINKNLPMNELLKKINEFLNKTKISFYFENGSEIGLSKTNETIRLYSLGKRVGSATDIEKFKSIVDKIYNNNKIKDKINEYRDKFRNQEMKQYIIKILKSILKNKRIEINNNGIITLKYKIEDVDIIKIYNRLNL